MTRRLWLCAVLLSLVALPVLARRRAITPRGPAECANATLVNATYADLLAADEQFVYLVDEMGVLSRVPKLGGDVEPLADPLDDWLPLAMTVDDTRIYIGVLPVEALDMPLPGAILTVPKTGGVVSVLLSGVVTPAVLRTDATHLYWASTGTYDFDEGTIGADGKVERVTKDGQVRNTLANGLSAPAGLALDGSDVYFGQTGAAVDDGTVGLYRMPKKGGVVATIFDDVLTGPIVVDGDTIVFLGITETGLAVLAVEKDGASPLRTLYASDRIENGLHVADRRAYFLQSGDGPGSELAWVSIDAPAGAVAARLNVDGDAFLLDGCAAIVNTVDGDVVRTGR
jgi:hypothetical protein